MQTPSTPGWPPRPAGEARARLPPRFEQPWLHGRDVELAFLFDMLDRATKGMGSASIVRGDAGIGKSTLLGAVVDRAREQAMTVLSTRGVQSEAHLPFAGLHQLLSPLLPRLDELGRVQRSSLLAAFGLEDAGNADPFRIALAALELLTDAASDGPLVLIADDAQLLDAPTVDVLTFVARRLGADPIVALFAVRGEAIVGAGLDALLVAPLDRAASEALLRQHAPDLSASTRERVLREAAGNPLGARGASRGDAIDRRWRGAAAGHAPADGSPGANVRGPRGGSAGRHACAAARGSNRPGVCASGAVGRGRHRRGPPAVRRDRRPRGRGGAGGRRRGRARGLPAPADDLGDPSGGVVRRSREGP
ncbi:MAG TPA: ATP-binding protein [Solirubrobacteraceae bacterium]|nr:ATP-binding protein [Solirubrobacteraceae bacterium]